MERTRAWRIGSPFTREHVGDGREDGFEFTVLQEVMEFRDIMALLALHVQPIVSRSSTTGREISWRPSAAVNRHYEEH